MVDFHTHILPGIDDGSKTPQESITLLQEEARQGIQTVCLTPHYYAGEMAPSEFLIRRDRSWRTLKKHWCSGLPDIRLGAEVQYFDGIAQVPEIMQLRIEGTAYLLMEMPFCQWTDRMLKEVLDLQNRDNLCVVLAHIERYLEKNEATVWRELLAHGVLMQSNVSFFYRWRTKYRAISMLKRGQIHFLGSDCHNMTYRCPNWDRLSPKVLNTYRTDF